MSNASLQHTTLAGHRALIIGANGGIGSAIAHALGTAGADLVLAARDGDRLEQLHAALAAAGMNSHVVPTDVTDDDAVQALVEQAAGFDIAVNNAGTAHRPTPLGELPIDEADRVLQTTLRGVLVAMHHELAALPDGGCIVNIASTAGLSGAPGMGAYVAAKHAVIGLTRTAALDYAHRGIRVNAVAPGSIDSGRISAQPDETRRLIAGTAPLGRLGHPDEVAAAVAWLVSPASSYTTGTVLTVDGGKGARGA
ncbi:SDR family NAD(P)-dependent oxidoreductase [Propionibacteriaceae bacterium G1746]|uniref:SDR family NAD(P)-dependent oxidoreductase n=1 Tax=Aestuariimicrobium sp. G57 TaxID=3418485 RepID=UPI003C1C88B1